MYQFRDPIHGFISVSEEEKRIIDSKPFQRLRNIKQLATTYLVYHGAEHTRFGHSIGVMHLVSKTFDAVVEKNPNLFSTNKIKNYTICQYYRQILRLIALTHDLGHAPFSHASEELFPDKKRHEDYTKDIIFNTEIGEYINKIGHKFQKTYGDEYPITPKIIWMIYNGDTFEPEYRTPDFLFLQGFMDGELDCDKMDYLLRDSKFCGVSYGKYDLERFISTLTVYKSANTMNFATKDKEDDSGRAIIILDRKTSQPRNLMEESRILNGIIEPINIWRIYVSKSEAGNAEKQIARLLKGR